ncbi:MAG TPA: hypothetical protein VNI61_07475, partial [Gemmatimonadales bacterium]|nr:hypothetical protein [Gemmatimonadales bacterium]
MTTAVAPSGLADDVALAEALALGPDVWDGLLTRSGAANPFMTWAWHRACVDAAPPEAAASSRAVLLRGGAGSVAAIFPYRLQSDAFWGLPVTTMGWAFGDLGCPDHLDIIASPESDLDALAGALESLPWVAVRLGSVAERASNVERWLEACKRRGWTIRRRRVGRCLYLDLPESWEAYLGG